MPTKFTRFFFSLKTIQLESLPGDIPALNQKKFIIETK